MIYATFRKYKSVYGGQVIPTQEELNKTLELVYDHFREKESHENLLKYYFRVADIIYFYNKNNKNGSPAWKDEQTQILIRNARLLYLGKAET